MIALLVAAPLAFAFATIAFPKLSKYILPLVVLFNLALLIGFVHPVQVVEIGKWPAAYGIVLLLDNVNYPFLLLVNLVLLALSISATYEDKIGVLLLVLTAALNGLLLTGDFFNSFVFLEIIAAVAYVLAAQNRNSYAAFKYLIFGSVAGVLYLIGVVSMYVYAGTLNMGYAGFIATPEYVQIAGVMILIALLVELKILPLGLWAPDVYSNGSTVTPVALGSTVTVAIFYLFSRIFFNVLEPVKPMPVYILSLISIVVSQLAAMKQKTLGRALAYASIAGASTVMAALSSGSLGSEAIVSAAYLYLFNEAISMFILFTIYGYLNQKGFKSNSAAGIAFSLATISLIGFPLTAGFWAKITLLTALFKAGDFILPAVLLAATVIEAGYLIKWNVDLWYPKEENEEEEELYLPFGAQVVILLFALSLVVIGFMPDLVMSYTDKAASYVFDFRTYFDTLLKGGM
ncbi:multicomponent Na+:H+ antiporter subunit D [Fervidobacterium changbaicum]|uniref:Na+/H+ antiporter subunit D n=1 Tax=Fervidobacterium changbaicum TaxID=310769 RepID=A0ABX5QSZ0_9BACT|nr:proton-conducting transporter membrane subunit [Fervidobacterium changbaicum]QAV33614.1 Na+/H+ antiporter subunit D [Fervidobacterium changbaicum]SDH71867.1 multicomponent Na+:H+ antiporter subunit D [Fervidobacterium changbaicum]